MDGDGDVQVSRKYDVYGFVRGTIPPGTPGLSRHKFVRSLGHVLEDETGLIHLLAHGPTGSLPKPCVEKVPASTRFAR